MLISLPSLSQQLKSIEGESDAIKSIMVSKSPQRTLFPIKYELPAVNSFTNYRNDVSVLVSHQYNYSMCPVTNRNSNGMILGSIHQTNTTLGRKKITGTYVFDVMGRMVDYQMTISKSK